jgi:hypothetical protein
MRSSTVPISTISPPKNICIRDTHYYSLPGKRVLFLAHGTTNTSLTTLRIFSTDNLHTPLLEKTITGAYLARRYTLLGIFPDGSFLLREAAQRQGEIPSLARICSDTLKFISIQPREDYSLFRHAGIIDNENFFVITDKSLGSEHEFCLLSWNDQTKTYVTTSRTSPFADLKDLPYKAEKILSLGKNRYCCAFTAFNMAAFKVVVFDFDPESRAIKIHGLIEPTEFKSHDVYPAGRILAFPNGQLLTYHEAQHDNDHLQIWDIENLTCIKGWHWNKIQRPKSMAYVPHELQAFPDSRHLLIHTKSNPNGSIYIFNTHTLAIREISLPNKIISPANHEEICLSGQVISSANHHVLANGQVLAFMVCLPCEPLRALHFDVKEMIDFRKRMSPYKMSCYCVSQGMFSNTRTSALEKLPEDLRKIIATHAFTPEVEASFLSKEKKPQKESCRIM